ncbi:hypothetical protein [Parendozoicomonas sp. Alg238-R29]|uniref:hypothetical protein n=1 Tax=Parendozoicomonas sp. Alg238-R29 TaxID=2993446 RepID=UPI00248E405C|nr:hypothetical protein [Parendozoicomonas sp. Alg238-R29]
MTFIRTLARLGMAVALTASTGLSADLLTLEERGTSEIMAKIRATMNAEAAKTGSLIPWEFSYRAGGSDKIVQVLSPIPFTVKMDGERTDISLFNVRVNEAEAILTMTAKDDFESGESQMMIGYSAEKDERGVRYQVSFNGKEAQEKGMSAERVGGENQQIDIELETPQEFLPTQQEINTATTSRGNQPVTIFVFKHKDVRESVSSLTHEHFSWWARHMDAISQRHQTNGNGPLYSELVVDFRTDKKIQNFKYKGKPSEKLKELAKEFQRYKWENGIIGSYKRNKFLLLTEKMMNWKTLGIAYVGGQYGMAADDDDQVAAHEIGHMFNGSHDKADVVYNGWWCESILYWQHLFLRASCHRYTEANMNVIIDYLK